jgi:hypothetical protein
MFEDEREGGAIRPAAGMATESSAPVKTRVVMAAVRPESRALDPIGVIICPDPGTARAARRLSTFEAAAASRNCCGTIGRLTKRRDSYS